MPAKRTALFYRGCGKQRGAALMIMLVIMVMGAAAFLISSLSSSASNTTRQEKTAAALAQAKDALIGYAVSYGDANNTATHGYLPCPDVDELGVIKEGFEHGFCGVTDANTLGRLPWKSLGLPPLMDGSGECLWYAVSGTYKRDPKSSSKMNWDNTGKLKVFSTDGNEIAANEIVAVVIAPGSISPNNSPAQNRSGMAAPLTAHACGGNYTPASYLDNDTAHNINNSDIVAGKFILPHEHRDAGGNVTVSANDQFVYITRHDIWSAIQNRIVREARKCLDDYASVQGKYPWAVPVSSPTAFSPLLMGEYNTLFGRLSTRPNVQTESTPADITAMQSEFSGLWTALTAFAASKTAANLSAMQATALSAKIAADTVRNNYTGTDLKNPAADLKNAADDAMNNLTTASSTTDITAVQQGITNAANDFTNAMTGEFAQAPGMANTWPTSCALFSSARWEHWKDQLFYQVADGFKPGSAANCNGSCLSVAGSGHNVSGSGSYHAVLVAAGKKLTANRITTNPADYLEPANLQPKDNATIAYKTYRATDADYQTTNDLVLCVDGKIKCK